MTFQTFIPNIEKPCFNNNSKCNVMFLLNNTLLHLKNTQIKMVRINTKKAAKQLQSEPVTSSFGRSFKMIGRQRYILITQDANLVTESAANTG